MKSSSRGEKYLCESNFEFAPTSRGLATFTLHLNGAALQVAIGLVDKEGVALI